MRRLLLALLALSTLAGSSGSAHAQDLARVDTLLASGRFTEARNTLERWRAAHPRNSRDASPDLHARALLLEGRIASDPDAALDAYLSLVLGYPTAAEAPHALLLLGQGLLATGQPERARGYLERRVRDYPAAARRAEALLWLARAQVRTARIADACATLREAEAARTADADLRALLAHEQAQACSASADVAQPTQPVQPERTAPVRQERYTVQAGAFRTVDRAEQLANTLRERGFDDARIVYVSTSTLARVRIGYFANASDAAAFASRLRAAGFDAAVGTDAHMERAQR